MLLRSTACLALALVLAAPLAAQTAVRPHALRQTAQLHGRAERQGGGELLAGILTAASQSPATASTARGFAGVDFDRASRSLAVYVTVQDLGSAFTEAHLHQGAAGVSGPVLLSATTVGRLADGYRQVEIAGTLTPAQVAALDAGNLYVDVHSAAFPAGELRAQLRAVQTLREARAAGPGATVSVIAYVTRSEGRITYLSDDDGALAVAQTSGAWFQAVQSGTIRAGTVVQLTGTLSEVRGMLQVGQPGAANGLARFEVGPVLSTNVNALLSPFDAITLADVATNGEALEGQFVLLKGVTLAGGAGGTFRADTDVAAADGSAPATLVTVYVPASQDTRIVGQPVPTDAVNVIGIVAQSSATGVGGYRIVLVNSGDVDPQGSLLIIHNAPDPALARIDVSLPGFGTQTVAFRGALTPFSLRAYDGIEVGAALPGAAGPFSATVTYVFADDDLHGPVTLVAEGVLDPAQFADNPDGIATDFILFPTVGARITGDARVGVRVLFGTPDAPALDLRAGGTVVAGAVAYLGPYEDLFETPAVGFVTPPSTSVPLDVARAGSAAPLASFRADLSDPAGQGLTVLTSGFLNPAANGGGPAFGLLVVDGNGTATFLSPATTASAANPNATALRVAPRANPVRSATAVFYTTAASGDVRLSVVDVLGREVAVLASGAQPAGTHEAPFDASRLAPGVYTLRLVAGGAAATARVTVVR